MKKKIGAKKLMSKCCFTGNYFPHYGWCDEGGGTFDRKLKRGVQKRVRVTLRNEMLNELYE